MKPRLTAHQLDDEMLLGDQRPSPMGRRISGSGTSISSICWLTLRSKHPENDVKPDLFADYERELAEAEAA